ANRYSCRRIGRERLPPPALRLSLLRVVFVCVAFLALTIQALIVQTHFHNPRTALSAALNVITTDAAANLAIQKTAALPGNKYPPNEDPSCPLCQAIAHFGQFVHTVVPLAFSSLSRLHVIVLDEIQPRFPALSHFWQGRGPPRF